MNKLFVCLFLSIALVFIACNKKVDEKTADGRKIYKIAVGYFGPDEATNLFLEKFKNEMEKLGFKEGDNLKVHYFHASGEMANIPQQFQAADNEGNDLIVALTTPCTAAAATVCKKTNIVFSFIYDAVAAGVAKSLTDHKPNMTGIQSLPPLEQTLALLKETMPNLTTIATIYNAGEANSVKAITDLKKMLPSYGITLKEFTIASTNEILNASKAAVNCGAQAIWITGDNTVYQSFEGVLKPAAEKKIPVFINDIEFLYKGATAAVGITLDDPVRATAEYVAKVLKGTNTKDLPIQNITIPKVEYNEKICKELNITIPERYRSK